MARPRSSNNFFSPRSKKTQRMHVVCLFLPASKIAPQLLRLRYIERAQRSVSKYVIRQPTKPFLSAKTTSPLAYTVVQRFSFCTTDAAHHVPCRLPQPKQNQKSTIQDPSTPATLTLHLKSKSDWRYHISNPTSHVLRTKLHSSITERVSISTFAI